jgi:hypothetical protein
MDHHDGRPGSLRTARAKSPAFFFAMDTPARDCLPRAGDRLALGKSGLSVSPVCLGIAGSADTVLAAFDAGINFFFVTADLHWPLYEHLRQGLARLLARGPHMRERIVVGAVSYLEQPLFAYLQMNEVIDSVPGLKRVDLLIAGAVSSPQSLLARHDALQKARVAAHVGCRAIGATFHQRACALVSLNHACMDINYIRFNPIHARAVDDFFPHMPSDRTALVYNFKSTFPLAAAPQAGAPADRCIQATDYYRFALSHRELDGILCRLACPQQVQELVRALEERPLTGAALAEMARPFAARSNP